MPRAHVAMSLFCTAVARLLILLSLAFSRFLGASAASASAINIRLLRSSSSRCWLGLFCTAVAWLLVSFSLACSRFLGCQCRQCQCHRHPSCAILLIPLLVGIDEPLLHCGGVATRLVLVSLFPFSGASASAIDIRLLRSSSSRCRLGSMSLFCTAVAWLLVSFSLGFWVPVPSTSVFCGLGSMSLFCTAVAWLLVSFSLGFWVPVPSTSVFCDPPHPAVGWDR